jgi:hypothetical protein
MEQLKFEPVSLVMKHLPKRFKPSLESLLKDSQVLTGKDLLSKAKAKELELEQFNKSVEFEERNRKSKGAKTSS